MIRNQKLVFRLMDLSSELHWLAKALKNTGQVSVSYPELFKSFADTVDQVAKEVTAK